MKIIYTKNFQISLDYIVEFIARDSATRARDFANALKTQIEKIPSMPYSYRKNRIANDDKIRDLIFKGYVVIFEINAKNIEVLEIYKHNLPRIF